MRSKNDRIRLAEAVRVLSIVANNVLSTVREKIVELEGRQITGSRFDAVQSIESAMANIHDAAAYIVERYGK